MLKDIASLKDRWFELYPNFVEFREKYFAAIVRWEWANGPRYDPRPYYFQRHMARGRLLRRVPLRGDREDSVWKIGYDALGNTIVTRSDNGNWETIYLFEAGYVELLCYQTYYGLLRGISRLAFDAEHPSHFLGFILRGDPHAFHKDPQSTWEEALHGKFSLAVEREDYHYTARKLTQISEMYWENGYSYDRRERLWQSEYQLDYLPDGKLKLITQTQPDAKLVYQKRDSDTTLQRLTERVKSKLVETIPQVMKNAELTESLYCLQLHYVDDYFFPPILLPGFETRRQRLIDSPNTQYFANEIWASVWDFDEHEDAENPPYPITDEETLTICELLQMGVSVRGHSARCRLAVKTLRQVAKALNQLDWSLYIPVTPDFMVFAYDQEDISRALRLSGATPEQMIDWRKQGLL